MISKISQPLQVNSTLSTLLDKLREECEKALFLLSQLKLSNLTADQKGDILAELRELRENKTPMGCINLSAP